VAAEQHPEEEGVTVEFEIIYATLKDSRVVTTSENPRDTLTEEALAEHVEGLESVVRARARALAVEEQRPVAS
jgi:hypothetical protein